jgi:polysaccharide export outer membrane protein
VRVWEEERIPGIDVRVRQDGKITLPLVGELTAAGLTPSQFKEVVVEAARKYVNSPTVDVIVKETMSKRVYVQGEVRRPDTYPLSGRMTISQLIARAGGFTEYANKGKITVLRTDKDGNTTVLKINYNDLIENKNPQKNNIELVNGDVVNVPD